MLLLRDMQESDIEDYVTWFTTEIEWGNWDSPWEPIETDAQTERLEWAKYFESIKDMPDDVMRWKFEIECDGIHIGWVSSYDDLEYVDNPEKIPAIGINIPCPEHRKNGNGTKALQLFIDYMKSHGHRTLFTQTWSGNTPMIRVAEKLGFHEIVRKKDFREVNGKLYDAVTFQLDL